VASARRLITTEAAPSSHSTGRRRRMMDWRHWPGRAGSGSALSRTTRRARSATVSTWSALVAAAPGSCSSRWSARRRRISQPSPGRRPTTRNGVGASARLLRSGLISPALKPSRSAASSRLPRVMPWSLGGAAARISAAVNGRPSSRQSCSNARARPSQGGGDCGLGSAERPGSGRAVLAGHGMRGSASRDASERTCRSQRPRSRVVAGARDGRSRAARLRRLPPRPVRRLVSDRSRLITPFIN
jgi:hypothetical protein